MLVIAVVALVVVATIAGILAAILPARRASRLDVLTALAGTNSETDLTRLVTGLRNTAAAMNRHNGQFGSILDDLSSYLNGTANLSPRTTNGAGILDHTLGDRQETMQRALSAKSGLDMSTIMRLLPLLAPIVMGMLGKRGKSSGGGGTGGFSLDDIGDLLNREKQDARSKNPDIGDILDSFGKGSGAGSKSGGGIGDVLGGRSGRAVASGPTISLGFRKIRSSKTNCASFAGNFQRTFRIASARVLSFFCASFAIGS